MWELIQANKRKSTALIAILAAVFLMLGYGIGFSFDPQAGGVFGLGIAMIIWIVMMLVSLIGGERILLSTSGAREVAHDDAPQLFNIVEEMKIASGLPAMPKVYVIDSLVPNAFAVGLNPRRASIAVTTGLMSRLNRDELQGVVAHEIGHIVNRDTLFMTLAGITVGAIVMIADLYLRSMRYGAMRGRRSSGRAGGQTAAVMFIIALVMAIVAPLLGQILYFACSRRREYLADASAAQFTRYPEGLASALEKISAHQDEGLEVSRAVAPMFTVNPLQAAGSVSTIFSTHPPTEDRVKVLRSMVSGSSFVAYESAYRKLHRNRGVVGMRSLQEAEEGGIREAAAEAAKDPAKQWRQVNDIMYKLNQFGAIACACGLRMKLPPGFDQKTITCPRCGATHEVPLMPLMAAAAAIDAAQSQNTPMRPIYKK